MKRFVLCINYEVAAVRRFPSAVFVEDALLVKIDLLLNNVFVDSHPVFCEMGNGLRRGFKYSEFALKESFRLFLNLLAQTGTAHQLAKTWADVSGLQTWKHRNCVAYLAFLCFLLLIECGKQINSPNFFLLRFVSELHLCILKFWRGSESSCSSV